MVFPIFFRLKFNNLNPVTAMLVGSIFLDEGADYRGAVRHPSAGQENSLAGEQTVKGENSSQGEGFSLPIVEI
jgi:hypothetical protein